MHTHSNKQKLHKMINNKRQNYPQNKKKANLSKNTLFLGHFVKLPPYWFDFIKKHPELKCCTKKETFDQHSDQTVNIPLVSWCLILIGTPNLFVRVRR